MTDHALLTELSAIWDDAEAIVIMANGLRKRITSLCEARRVDLVDATSPDANDALQVIDYALEDVQSGLNEGLDDLSAAVDFDELEPKAESAS